MKEPPYVPSDEETRIIERCREHGVIVPYIYVFAENKKQFKLTEEIAKILADEIGKNHDQHLLMMLMMAAAAPAFRSIVLDPIAKVIRREGENGVGQCAVNALDKVVSQEDIALVESLLRDKAVEGSRSLLVPIYARIAKKAAIPVLRLIMNDPDVHSYALKHLSILGDTTIEPELRALAKHPDSYHRQIARDALKRVERNKQKLQQKTSTH
jgi:hypothetical protein